MNGIGKDKEEAEVLERNRMTASKEENRSLFFGRLALKRRTILVIVIFIIAILFILAYLSIGIEQSTPFAGAIYPWTVTYDVLFPDGKQVYIGSTSIVALSYQDEVIIDVDGKRDKMVAGEERLISEKRAVIRALGIPLADTNYQMYVRFIGVEEKKIRFYLTIKTTQQVPQFLIDRILPGEIQAKPA